MAEPIVINTGPLLAFARADLLDLVRKLPFDFIYPDEVRREIADGVIKGYPKAYPEWMTQEALSSPIDRVAQFALDSGEAAVIQLALEKGIQRVCIDEKKGRLVAQGIGLSVTGSLGLMIRAKKLNLIPKLRPIIQNLKRTGTFYKEDLVRYVLHEVGE